VCLFARLITSKIINHSSQVVVAKTHLSAITTMATAQGEPPQDHKSIDEWIEAGEWDIVTSYIQFHPEEIRGKVDPFNGSTILHAICFIISSPESLVELVVDTWPEALTIQEKKFGATPLHILCWSSQRSSRKVEILLNRMQPKDLMIRNRVLGSTALHSACGNNAELPVIRAIVKKYPPILLAKTFDQNNTALNAVWHAHLQTIPGEYQQYSTAGVVTPHS
jgi:hypothetical protein